MGSIKVTFRDAKGNDIKTIEGNEGDDLLSLAHEHDVDLEGTLFSSQNTASQRELRYTEQLLRYASQLTNRGM
jgi:hypothetical protein